MRVVGIKLYADAEPLFVFADAAAAPDHTRAQGGIAAATETRVLPIARADIDDRPRTDIVVADEMHACFAAVERHRRPALILLVTPNFDGCPEVAPDKYTPSEFGHWARSADARQTS